jgi:ribosomal protein S18 acetylase RimI-like enzyme
MSKTEHLQLRRAGSPTDVEKIAALHADSWRRHYRGAYSDPYLDGDLQTERLAVWRERFETQRERTATIMAETDGVLVGFVHVVLDDDATWGSLIDNLHVRYNCKRAGIGRTLMAGAADVAVEHGSGGLYLWVLEQNQAAQAFYGSLGGSRVEHSFAGAPGGDLTHLKGRPMKLRYFWHNPSVLRDRRRLHNENVVGRHH